MTTLKSAPETADDAEVSTRSVLLVFAGLLVAMLLAALDQTIFATALPTIVGQLDGVQYMLWVTTVYILASTIMMPVYGKLGDLIGRKGLFISAISLFLVGSVIGGLAGDMTTLIIGRSVQGLGGGGLMLLAQAIIADVVPARQRGKYMGVMGAVFAVASVAGPLLGGFYTDSIGWRWAFWMNLPTGVLAILAAVFFLHLPKGRTGRPRIDFTGMVLVAVATACLVLFTTWGGSQYDWDSPTILALIAGTVAASVLFVFVERHAAEPIIPLRLFRDRNFDLATVSGLIIGVAMFGAIAYLPTYLQMVTGVNATIAGFLMIPMMAGLLVASIGSGALVSKTGRYKGFPIAGTLIVAAALGLLSTMTPTMPIWLLCSYLAVMGIGLGLVMQILVLIVQNSFPNSLVGTATAGNNFFRQIGASLGSAVVGSLFTTRLLDLLAVRLPGGGSVPGGVNSLTPNLVDKMPSALRVPIISAYNDALVPVFLYLVPLVLLACVLLCFLKEVPLATRIERDIPPATIGEAGTAPREGIVVGAPEESQSTNVTRVPDAG